VLSEVPLLQQLELLQAGELLQPSSRHLGVRPGRLAGLLPLGTVAHTHRPHRPEPKRHTETGRAAGVVCSAVG